MNRTNRPVGRQKRVGSGSAGVHRRGSGLGGSTGGPVGNPDGYPGGSAGPQGGGFDPGNGGFSPGGGYQRSGGGVPRLPGGKLKYIVIIGIVLLGLYLLYSMFLKGDGQQPNGGIINNNGNNTSQAAYYDQGAYAAETSVSPDARPKRTVLAGGGSGTVTVMVYMCGTDLESRAGMATADLQEMANAEISNKVKVIVETGGTAQWKNSVISNRKNQRFQLTGDGLVLVDNTLGRKSMVDPDTLSDFIRYCKAKYPADRYELILWDHGGGSLSGYGYDEFVQNDSMSVEEIALALKQGGCAFDFIGFDACLMATLETAVAAEPYADYLIASEETEPGIGWYYTGWLTALSRDTSIPTVQLGKRIIDDYVAQVQAKTPRSQATLSLTDLAELKGTVPGSLTAFSRATSKQIKENDYKAVADARAGAKEFSPASRLNQIDFIDFAEKIGTGEAKALAKALRGCVKYNRLSGNITDANGLSVFFPYGSLSKVGTMLDTYENIGIDDSFGECVRSFASTAAGGQVVSTGSGSALGSLLSASPSGTGAGQGVQSLLNAFLSGGDFSAITGIAGGAGWLDIDRMKASADYYAENRFDASALVITEKNGRNVIELPEEQWALVEELELNVFIDDGSGFIDLGLDNVYEFTDDGNLIMDYDGTWLALNGNIVAYYMTGEDRYGDTYSIKGRVPAMLNGKRVELIIEFTDQNPDGAVLGAQTVYAATETPTTAKGLTAIAAGDKIDFLCDYYTYDGDYNDSYYLGDRYTATGKWTIENLAVDNADYRMTYRVTDLYGNRYWTQALSN